MASAHAVHEAEIRNPGTYDAGTLKMVSLILSALGTAIFVVGVMTDPARAWPAFVINHFFFMSLAIGGIFFAAIQWLTSAMWSAPVRRLSEAFTSFLPVSLLTTVILYFGIQHLYIWSHSNEVMNDLVLKKKAAYLSPVFFIIRNIGALGILTFFSRKMVGNSVAQDKTRGDMTMTMRNKRLAPAFLILFALLYTMMSFDQMMSLDPHWYSTMFGVYCFAGLFYANLAVTCLLTLYVQKSHKLDGIVNDNHIHDLGKFMFAFTIFWAYIAFSQFMLMWYANLPEETLFFIHRLHGGWFAVSCFLLFGKFFTPFFLLLPRDAKRNKTTLTIVAIFMLVAQFIDIAWIVEPQFYPEGPQFGWMEIGITLGFLGTFIFLTLRFLGQNCIVAIGDPRLAESVYHHHQ